MAIKSNTAKREAGKVSAKMNNNRELIAEIGRVWLSMSKVDGRYSITLSTDCVDPFLNSLDDYLKEKFDVDLEPEYLFTGSLGFSPTEVDAKAFRAALKFAKDNGVHFAR